MKTKMAFLGCILATLTLAAGIALLSLSGWFISAAAFAGLGLSTTLAFNYFLPSTGVRFFSSLRILARYGERVVTHEVTFKTLSHLRVALYSVLEPLAPSHLIRYHSGEILNRMVSDVDTLDQLYIRIITPLVAALGIIILLGIYLHFFSMSFVFLICGMLLFGLVALPLIMAVLGKKAGEMQLLLNAGLRQDLVNGVQNLGELILLGQWEKHRQKIAHTSHALIKTQFKMACIQGLASALLLLLSGGTLVLLIAVATPMVRAQSLNGANIALVGLAGLAAFEALAPISAAAQYWSKIKLASTRLNALKNTAPAVSFPPHSQILPQRYDIVWRGVSFGYTANQPVLQNFNLTLHHGEHMALVGPSGSGKSTVIHLLARFFDPDAGDIQIGQVPIQNLAETDLRRLMSVITQRPHLFSATLRDNLLLAQPEAKDMELIEALGQVQLQDWFNNLTQGLDTWLGEGGIQLSGGQLHRLAVARALLHNAPIWLLDEPTEGLDRSTELAFWAAISPLMTGRTVLMISHQLNALPHFKIQNINVQSQGFDQNLRDRLRN